MSILITNRDLSNLLCCIFVYYKNICLVIIWCKAAFPVEIESREVSLHPFSHRNEE